MSKGLLPEEQMNFYCQLWQEKDDFFCDIYESHSMKVSSSHGEFEPDCFPSASLDHGTSANNKKRHLKCKLSVFPFALSPLIIFHILHFSVQIFCYSNYILLFSSSI